MTTREKLLTALILAGIAVLVVLGLWSLRPPQVPEPATGPAAGQTPPGEPVPQEVLQPPPLPQGQTRPERIELTPDAVGRASIAGKVVDEQGKPLEGVLVTAIQRQQALRSGFSGPEGRYEIRALAPGYYDLRTDKEGYAVATRRNIQVNKEQTTSGIDFELVPGGIFSSVVVDEYENPIPGARVTLYASGPGGAQGLAGPLRTQMQNLFHAQADARGAFVMPNIAPGDYLAIAQHDDYIPSDRVPITIRAFETSTHKFILELGGSVSGTVTDTDGNPVPEAPVWLTISAGNMARTKGGKTDMQGKYIITGLPTGVVTVKVASPSHVTATRENIQVLKGQRVEGIDFKLERGGTVSGIVVGPEGEPVTDADVSGTDTRGFKTTRTDPSGAFALTGFTGEKVNLSVRAQGFVLLVKRDVPANTRDLRLTLSRGGSVEGQAIAGEPLKYFVVAVYTIAPAGGRRTAVTQQMFRDPQGAFKLENIPEGRYSLEISSTKYIHASPEIIEVSVSAPVTGLKIPLVCR